MKTISQGSLLFWGQLMRRNGWENLQGADKKNDPTPKM